MAKGLPEHRQIVVFQAYADDMFDADALWVATLQSISDVQRAVLAFAGAT